MVSPERWAVQLTPTELNLKDRRQRETDGQCRGGQPKCEFGCAVSE